MGHGLFTGKVKKKGQLSPLWVRSAFGSKDNFERVEACEALAKEKGYTMAQIALAWTLHSPMNVFPIVGTLSPKHLQATVDALEITLSDEEYIHLCKIRK